MKFRSLLLLATASITSAAAVKPAVERDVAVPTDLVGHTCVANGCKSAAGTIPGIYCAQCASGIPDGG
ncbi:hypothetical protein V501_01320 [Pseudogymnoascus sp. VKM F-4519 (FW-2642)]|nr:hypothetical protein V501_01320 [Pseudogymnoascus sp. VKM F-4519 (FW-2642)]